MNKSQDKEKEKLEKQVDSFLKKGKCLELVTVFIHNGIIDSLKNSRVFLDSFTSLKGPLYEIVSDCVAGTAKIPNCVRWVTKRQRVELVDGSWSIKASYLEDKSVVVIINGGDFIDLIRGCCGNLDNISSIADLISTISNSNLEVSIILYDLEFELLKLKKKVCKRKPTAATGVEEKGSSEICVETLDSVRLELEMEHGITVWSVEGLEEAGAVAMSYTKAVAEREMKERQSNKTDSLFSFTVSKEGCCRLLDNNSDRDSRGGVDLLWRRQLTEFSGVTEDTVGALVALYPTARALHDSLVDTCSTLGEKAAIDKIANIDVRRGTELLSTSRKIGKEVAKRIYEFITSVKDENVNIF